MAGHIFSNVYNAFLLLSIHFTLLKNNIQSNKWFLSFGVVNSICFTFITVANEHIRFTLCIQIFPILLWHMSICQTTKNSKMLDSRLLIIPSLKRSLAFNTTNGVSIQNIVGCPHYFSPIHAM